MKNIFVDTFIDNQSRTGSKIQCVSGKNIPSSRDELFSIEDTNVQDRSDYSLIDDFDDDDVDDERVATSLLENDLNEKYKSIRRDQVRSGSIKHIQNALRSLKTRTLVNLESNRKMFEFSDRNVRYGDPLPQRSLYRELRILSKFELKA